MKKIIKSIVICACVMFSLEGAKANSKLDTIVTSIENMSTIDIDFVKSLPQIVTISKNIFLTIDRNTGCIKEIYQGRIKVHSKVMVKKGFYLHFNNNSTIDIIGRYKNNKKDGLWEKKDESGIWIFENWEKGVLLKSSKIN